MIQTFENFQQKEEKKPVLSTHILKSEFFSMLNKDQKAIIKALAGKDLDSKKDPSGDFIVQTGNEKIKEITIPKKFVYTY